MSQAPANASAPANQQLLPPEEQFWIRYSPHHEFPLSSVISFTLHSVVIVGMIVGAILMSKLGLGNDKPPEAYAVIIEPAGGDRKPAGAPGKGIDGLPPENLPDIKKPDDAVKKPVVEDLNPVPQLKNDDKVPLDVKVRQLEDENVLPGQLDELNKKLDARIKKLIDRGPMGPGGGGGTSPTGTGPGEGPGQGPGTGNIGVRQKRQMRWTLIFNTRSGLDGGRDYLQQLRALGAILAIPLENDQFMVYHLEKSNQGKIEDISQINRIYWVDNRPQSVQGLAMAMGIRPPPVQVVAFFPIKLEQELEDKEKKALRPGANVDEIVETKFVVMSRTGGKYDIRVESQR